MPHTVGAMTTSAAHTSAAPHSAPSSENYGRIAASEAVGTALLMIGGPGMAILGGGSAASVALAGGLTLMILVYILGPSSGAHVNPAVTLGMLLAKRIPMRWAVTAWIAQFAGAIAGAAVIWGIGSGRDPFLRGNFAANGFDRVVDASPFSGVGAVIIVEILFTALLVMVYLFAALRRFAPSMVGIVTGATLALGWLITAPIDGGSMNPARSLASALFADSGYDALSQVWVFIVFPLVGAVIGVIGFLILDDTTLEQTMLVEVPGATAVRDAAANIDDAID